jgi:hypothetical protein
VAAACSRVHWSAVQLVAAPAGLRCVLLSRDARRERFCTAVRAQKAGRKCCSICRCPVASSPRLHSMLVHNCQHSSMRSLQTLQYPGWRACCSDGQAGRWQPTWWPVGGCAVRPRPGDRSAPRLLVLLLPFALCTITLQAADKVVFSD